ncbi:VOC family protein [Brevundimonas subvibrioides]|uniref:VOC family protein n=1 Tax=Brevundimonas subvibrioides TaxID=74313 RepID=UPI0022B5B099|nr:VOC family protein [Brevundimonas subvibrioides]
MPADRRIVPCLWFDTEAEEAVNFYVSVLPDSRIEKVVHAPADYPGGKKDSVLMVEFTMAGAPYTALNGGPYFTFTEAISLQIETADQAETDRLYDALSAVPDAEQCGWVKDRYGLSWQIIPAGFTALMSDPDPAVTARAFAAMMEMKRLDVDALRAAARA